METPVSFTKRERDVINLAKKGYSYKEMAEYYSCTYYMINHLIKAIYKKLDVRSMPKMLAQLRKLEDTTPILDIAKQEWEDMYPHSDLVTMSKRERDFAWEHWLRAWQQAEKRFK